MDRGRRWAAAIRGTVIVAGSPTRRLGIMDFGTVRAMFHVAGFGLAIYVVCNFLLRRLLASDSDAFEQLFAPPVLGRITGAPRQLRAKYFIPWVPSPEYLAEESRWAQTLFWGARLGGTTVVVGLLGLLLSVVYDGTIGHL